MNQALTDRELGQFPLSIATSLAFEGATGIHPEQPKQTATLADYGELWVNLRTLFRNIYNAVHKDAQGGLTPEALVNGLMEEIDHLDALVQEQASNMRIVYYVSNYAGLARKYPKGLLRKASTERQQIYAEIQRLTIKGLLTDLGRAGARDVRVFELDLKSKNPSEHYGKALMLTHYAYDLLSHYEFQELALLESHTGAIKPRALWYTKYVDGKELSCIPFRADLIQIFGDSELFSAWNIKDRRPLIELAKAKGWHALTTVSKIRQDIRFLVNPVLHKTVNELLLGT